jgi:hypothetical protein
MITDEREMAHDYEPPTVTNRGPVIEVTRSHTVLVGAKLAAAFASSVVPGPHGGVGGVTQVGGSSGAPGGIGGGGGGAGGFGAGGGAGGAGDGGGGGGKLPFTGLAVAVVAAVGVSLAAAGDGLRRLARRRPARDGR